MIYYTKKLWELGKLLRTARIVDIDVILQAIEKANRMLVDLDVVLQAIEKANTSGRWGTACVEAMQAAIRNETGGSYKTTTTDQRVQLLWAQASSDTRQKIERTYRELYNHQKDSTHLTELVHQPFYKIVRPLVLRQCQAIEAKVSSFQTDRDDEF